MFILLIWIAVLIAAVALYFHQVYSRFSKYGVKHMKVVPFFGNMHRLIFRMDTFSADLERTYNTFREERFVGRYEFMKPMVFIRDLELVKKITVKDFEHFLDHRGFTDETVEPMFARNLFSLKGQEWKDMRSTLSPAFTSSKIKLMVLFMEEVGKQMIRALEEKIKESDTGSIDLDCKDLTTRFSNDVIASCAFGLKVDSFTEEENKFYEMGKTASTFKFKQMLFFFAYSAFPALVKNSKSRSSGFAFEVSSVTQVKLDIEMVIYRIALQYLVNDISSKRMKLSFFSNQTKDFFVELVMSTMKDRESRHIIRPDMIHLLMEVKKGQLVHDDRKGTEDQDVGFSTVEESSIGKKSTDRVWSDIDLIAQAVLFFIAGFDTISTAMSFALHELALHPEVQERLVEEIKERNTKNGGKLNFTSIQDMNYLDMVTSEALRLWPPGLALDRMCVKDYNLGKPNSKAAKDYIIRKGELVSIPAWCFHRDPEFFPDPTKFDPERFSDENKHKINYMAYMPFGVGPRNCIGSRFALCELKVLLYQILLHFEISPSKKTCIPSKLSTESFNPRLVGGHWLQFKIRN